MPNLYKAKRAEMLTRPHALPQRREERRVWLPWELVQTLVSGLVPLALLLGVTAVLLFAVLRSTPVWTLDIGAPEDAHFVAGFLPRVEEEATTFRWSSADAQVLLPRTSAGVLRLRLHGDAQALSSNQQLHVRRAGMAGAMFRLESGWRVYQVLLPPSPVREAGVGLAPIQLTSTRYAPDAQSTPALGMPIDWVQVAPLSGAAAPLGAPLRQTLLLTWGLALVAGVFWRLDRALLPRRAAFLTGLRVGGLLAVVATGLVLWAEREPYILDWAWPMPPWVLAIATLLVGLGSVAHGGEETQGDGDVESWRHGSLPHRVTVSPRHRVTPSPVHPLILPALLVILAHLLLLVPLPIAWRGIAALVVLGLPGVLLALLLFRAERDALVRVLLGLCGGLALATLLVFALHAIPGPLPWWLLLLACDGLSVWLGWRLWRTDAGRRTMNNGPRSTLHAPLLLILLLAVVFRLPFLGNAEFQGDEAHLLLRAAGALHGQDEVLLLRDKGPTEILLIMGPLALTGQTNELIARLPFTLAGLGVLLGSYLLSRHMLARGGELVGLAAATILALDGFLIGFGRIAQYQSIVVLMTIGALWYGWRFYEGAVHPQRYLLGAALLSAVGMLAHYDGVFALPALAWLVLAGGWRRRWSLGQWIGGVLPALLVGGGLLLSFFLPFVLHERFAYRTSFYLTWRLGQREATTRLHNNLGDYYDLATFYNTTYQVHWLVLALVAGVVVWLLLYARPRVLGWALAALLLAGCVLQVFAPERFVALGVNWAVLVFTLPLAGLVLSPATPFALRTLLIWFGAPFVAESFLIAVPRTHFYTLVAPAALLIALAGVQLGQWLAARRLPWLRFALASGSIGLVLLATPYLYLVFVQQVPEYHRSFPAVRSSVYQASYGDTLPKEHGYFGFPHQDGWKVVGELYRQGIVQGSYDSNTKRVITGWYARAFRCNSDPDYFFVALRDENVDTSIQMRIWHKYHLFGYILTDGIRTMDIYSRQPVGHPPRVFVHEDYAPTFDAQPVPDFPLQRILLEMAPQYELESTWQQGLRLRGYDLDRRHLVRGQTATLSLFWQATRPLADDYELVVDVLDYTGQRVMRASPACGDTPPSAWYPYYFSDTSFTVTAGAQLPPGEYTLQVGLRDIERDEWLPLADGSDTLNLTRLTIGSE